MTQLPKFIQHRLELLPAPSEHPSADVLSALPEDALDAQERTQMLAHLSSCADCRQVLWHVLPGLDSPEFNAESEAKVIRAPAGSTWFGNPVLRWGMAAACLFILAGGVALEYAAHRTETSARLSAKGDVTQPQAAAAVNARLAPPPPNAAEPGNAKSLAEQPELSANAPAVRRQQAEGTKVVAALEPPSTSRTAFNGVAGAKGFAGSISPDYAGSSIVTGKAFPRWTLTSDGLLQRSLDAGKTWQSIVIPGNHATLRAIAAHGSHIWVGGASGILYHSSNAGRDWSQVKPVAQGKTMAGDVIGIEFPTIRTGKLITTLQETWTTSDGGNTWQRER